MEHQIRHRERELKSLWKFYVCVVFLVVNYFENNNTLAYERERERERERE